MAQKLRTLFILMVLLAPSARLAWVAREMPHFGHLHDDSSYWVAAKSLAQGKGYRILNLPAEPYQTKFPPLWPILLAGIWVIDAQFPENLRLALGLAWLVLPVLLVLLWRWLGTVGFEGTSRWILCAGVAFSPWVIFLSTTLMADLLFSAFVVAAATQLERIPRKRDGFGAGVLLAAAYLTKTAALPFVIAGPLWLLWQRRFRAAAWCSGALLVPVAGWTWWVWSHRTHATDIVSLYHTNYLGFYAVTWNELPLVAWKNLEGLFSGITGLLIFDAGGSVAGVHLSRLIAFAVIAGTVRLARLIGLTAYHALAAAYVGTLLVWHYPPNERFLLPIFPLLLAGLATELCNLGRTLKIAWSGDMAHRAFAAAISVTLTVLACAGLALNARAIFQRFPGIIAQHRLVAASNRSAFDWLAKHTEDPAFYAYDDSVFYLYTGRHAANLPLRPLPFYREDLQAILRPFHTMPAFMREQGLAYLFVTDADFHLDLTPSLRQQVTQMWAQEPAFKPVYHSSLTSVYRVK